MLKSRKKRLAKQRGGRGRRRERFERNVLPSRIEQATSIAVSAATSAKDCDCYSKREDLESKKEQQRQAWTAESKTTKEEKWYVLCVEMMTMFVNFFNKNHTHTHRFYVDSKGSQRGPMSKSILKSLIDTNTITSSTYVWKVSMKTWKRLRDVPSLLRRSNEERQHETKSSKVSEPLSPLDWNRKRNPQKREKEPSSQRK